MRAFAAAPENRGERSVRLSRAIISRHILTDASIVMKRSTVFLAVIAIAALAAAVVTEISHRVIPGNYVGLLAMTFLACLVTALAVARTAGREAPVHEAPVQRRERPPRARRETKGERESGIVKWFDPTKGFGFIIRDVGGDVFVHRRSIRSDGSGDRELREGARVTFVAVERSRGWRAEEVSTQDE